MTRRRTRTFEAGGGIVKLSVAVDADQIIAFDRIAARQRVNRSALIRQAMDLFLAVNMSRHDSIHTDTHEPEAA